MRTHSLSGFALAIAVFFATTAHARYFSAREGNFLSPDRAGMIDGPNKYQYVRGHPTMGRDPEGTRLTSESPELQGVLNDLTSRSPQAALLVTAVQAAATWFVLRDGALGLSAWGDESFGQIGYPQQPHIISGCTATSTGYGVMVDITIDLTKARTFDGSTGLSAYQQIPADKWARYQRAKDSRVTMFHELLHALQYIQAVEGAPWFVGLARWAMPGEMQFEAPYRGSVFPPKVSDAISDQHPVIFDQIEPRIFGQVSE